MWKLITGLQGVDLFCLESNYIKFRGKIRQNEIQLIVPSYFSTNFLRLFCKALRQWLLHQIVMYGLASFAGWASRRNDGIVPAKSIQKPREQKNSFGERHFSLASYACDFHVSDFLPLLRRVIRKSDIPALEQFLLTFSNYDKIPLS